MPRRLKEGLDYFPVDTKIFSDPKIVRLMYDHGPDAVMIYFMFLSKVYDNGYFLECDLEKLAYLISYEIRFKETNKDLDYVYKILLDFVKLDIIDEASLNEGIITSKGIQKQFLASTQRRKQRERKHWILTPEDEESVYKTYGANEKTLSGINVNNNSVQGELMSTEIPLSGINVDNNIAQGALMSTEVHKVKVKVKGKGKVKGKEDKEDRDDKYDKGGLPFEAHYFLRCLLHDHLLDIYAPKIDELNELFIAAEQSYTKEHCFWIFKYVRAKVVENKNHIDSIPDYFMTAYRDNLKQMEGYYERMEELFKSWGIDS